MTDFVNSWNTDSFLSYPVGPLGLIAMPGTEEIGEKVNNWLKKWRDHVEESEPGDMRTSPGMERQDFLIKVTCPRFGNGEAKGMIKESIRGYDMYILVDPGAYNVTYQMFCKPEENYCRNERQGQTGHGDHADALRSAAAPPGLPGKPGLRHGAAGTGGHGRQQYHHV